MLHFKDIIDEEKEKQYFKDLMMFLEKEYKEKIIYPPKNEIFNSLEYLDYEDVKVVIIGQDPYHGEGQSHGFCFSVKPNIKIPPSLRNIYKELNDDLGFDIPNNGYLMKWVEQGVLLLNAVFTVEKSNPGSHRKKGWETFTDTIIQKLNEREKPVVFLLWGNYAKEKEKIITNKRHLVLKSTHPSPFSARNGFYGCKHFSKTNEFLKLNGMKEIDFQIENIDENKQINFLKGDNNNENK